MKALNNKWTVFSFFCEDVNKNENIIGKILSLAYKSKSTCFYLAYVHLAFLPFNKRVCLHGTSMSETVSFGASKGLKFIITLVKSQPVKS